MKRLHIFIILSVLLLSSALAATSTDFVLSTKAKELSLCSCQTFTDSITIYNTGIKDTWYKVETTDERVIPSSSVVFAARTGSVTVNFSIAAACTDKKSFSYSIIVTSLAGTKKQIDKQVSLEQCNNVKIALVPSQALQNANNTLQPCSVASYTLYMQNVGPFTDRYTYTVVPGVGNNSLTIEPGQVVKKNIALNFSCDMYGTIPVEVTVQAEKSRLSASLQDTITILKAYDYTLSFSNASMNICRQKEQTIPVAIENLANLSNTYTLALKAPAFVSLSKNSISLKPYEDANINLLVGKHEGNGPFDITITATSQYGNIVKEITTSLSAFSCSGISLTPEMSYSQSCDDPTYTITLSNTADVAQDVFMSVSSDIASFDKNKITLQQQESQTIKMFIQNPHDDVTYNLTITGTSDGTPFSIPFSFKAVSEYACTFAQVPNADLNINYQTAEKQVEVQNNGLQDAAYTLKLKGLDWVTLKGTELTLSKGQSQPVVLLFEDRTGISEGTYTATLQIISKETKQTYEQAISIHLKDKSELRKAYERVYAFFMSGLANSVLFYLICLLIVVVVVFFIVKLTAPNYPYNVANQIKKRMSLLVLLLVIFVIAVAVVYGIFGLPYIPTVKAYLPENNDSRILQWAEGTTYTFNISEFVTSPDMIPISFNVSKTPHVQATIAEDIVTFIPEKGWYGDEKIYFIATDAFGETVKSSPLTLRVIQVPELTFYDYAKPFFWTLNLIILLIILTIFFFTFVVANRRPKKKK